MLETLAIMQHHDAITGTHRELVGENYRRKITAAVMSALKHIERGVVS